MSISVIWSSRSVINYFFFFYRVQPPHKSFPRKNTPRKNTIQNSKITIKQQNEYFNQILQELYWIKWIQLHRHIPTLLSHKIPLQSIKFGAVLVVFWLSQIAWSSNSSFLSSSFSPATFSSNSFAFLYGIKSNSIVSVVSS